ncbi:MAG: hypothetical protein HQM10_11770 [Candidatus Riflebacteria bacterium]|nr:hypothetical protein [Candidatus Riflebacteria bacterium]
MKSSFLNSIFVIVILCLFSNISSALATHSSNEIAANRTASLLDPEFAILHKSIADALSQQTRNFVTALNQTGVTTFEITESVFDSAYRRYFLGLKGEVRISRAMSILIRNVGSHFEGEGILTYDLSITEKQKEGGFVRYVLEGEFILFQDQLLNQLAESIPGMKQANSPAGKTLLKFLNQIDVRPLAIAASKTLINYSPENLQTLRGELDKRIESTGNSTLERTLFLVKGLGNLGSFYMCELLKTNPESVVKPAKEASESLGAMIGTLMVPVIGGAIGRFIGGVIVDQIANATVYCKPFDHELAKIRRYGKLASITPGTDFLDTRFEASRLRLQQLIQQDLRENSYVLTDRMLEVIRASKKKNIAVLLPIVRDFRETLQFRFVSEEDRYAGKKMAQLEEIMSVLSPSITIE